MHPNEKLLHTFYSAFQQKDYQSMRDCYHPEAVFKDEVFQDLNAEETGKMWEMLVKRGTDLVITFSAVQADDQKGSVHWTARYTFSSTGRKVLNSIHAKFEFKDGKIYRHTDRFNFYQWARQAMGTTGYFMGWAPLFQKKVRAKARESLDRFMAAGIK
jgi:ketosteroid isomerase-like protein